MPVNADHLPETAAPPPGLVTAGYFDERPGYAVSRPRGADSWLFTFTALGRGLLRQGDARAEAGPGDLVVLGPGVPHQYATAEGAGRWAFWWVHCRARAAWGPWLRPHAAGGRLYAVAPVPAAVRPRIAAAFRRLHADARWPGHGAPPAPGRRPAQDRVAVAHGTAARELALTGLEEVILLATAAAGAPAGAPHGRAEAAGPAAGDPRVRRVVALIAADPGAPHTVESLAAQVALSPSRLGHLFAEQVGDTPMRVLRDARLRHAARLLEATDLPVARVAAASGFASPFHFSRVFRARYGAPPGGYRARLR
ncbi:helix-turn-helix domain-containing protein [Streptomyces marincola]|uniref:helix-turn-helix domain-containing protein n=1 Tax=Streptomyces marincola TaxID=2878388 RepID=UPI001CF3FE43|nr:helix-turn-helix domain-containing protein [Streptomyces marincola]UCM87106.1 helix-turn-helix domain-containing protein [Streptomyces marincola]